MRQNIALLRLRAQHIAPPFIGTPEQVVTRLGAVQAQDYAGALWSVGLRSPAATRADVEQAIMDRTIVRTWPMRGTLHFVPAVDARWMVALMAPRIIKRAAGRHRQLELDAAVFKRSRTLLTKALTRDKVLTRNAIFGLLDKAGIAPTGQRGIHILQQLCMEGTLCYGPHDDKQPTFVLLADWIPQSRTLGRDEALQTIAHRYFTSHGPATLRDFVWWTGLLVADARLALELAQEELQRLTVDATEYWMRRAVTDTPPIARAHLLPGFDEFLLGYTDRSAALAPAHAARIVPGGNGMFLSTIVLDGVVRGTWRRTTRANGVALTLIPFSRITARDKTEFDAAITRLSEYMQSPTTVTWEKPG